jgi:hypothetical protein
MSYWPIAGLAYYRTRNEPGAQPETRHCSVPAARLPSTTPPAASAAAAFTASPTSTLLAPTTTPASRVCGALLPWTTAAAAQGGPCSTSPAAAAAAAAAVVAGARKAWEVCCTQPLHAVSACTATTQAVVTAVAHLRTSSTARPLPAAPACWLRPAAPACWLRPAAPACWLRPAAPACRRPTLPACLEPAAPVHQQRGLVLSRLQLQLPDIVAGHDHQGRPHQARAAVSHVLHLWQPAWHDNRNQHLLGL